MKSQFLRAMVFVCGVLLVFEGLAKYQQYGAFPHLNWLGQQIFPLGVVAAGALVYALAFVPQEWLSRWARTRPQRDAHVLKYLDDHKHDISSKRKGVPVR